MILGDVRHKAAWVKEVDIMLRLQHPGDHLHQNRQLSLLVIVSMTYDVNCPELLKTLNNSPWFSTFPLRRRLMSAHSRGSWPRHQVLYKMMNNRPKHQFLENQHFLDMLELCVQASAAVKTKKRVVATTSSLVIHIQHQLSRFEMQGIKIIALSPNLCNSLHSKKTTTVALFCFFHFSSPSSSLLSDNYNAFLMFNMLTNLSFFLPQWVANTLHGVLWIRWDNKLEEN